MFQFLFHNVRVCYEVYFCDTSNRPMAKRDHESCTLCRTAEYICSGALHPCVSRPFKAWVVVTHFFAVQTLFHALKLIYFKMCMVSSIYSACYYIKFKYAFFTIKSYEVIIFKTAIPRDLTINGALAHLPTVRLIRAHDFSQAFFLPQLQVLYFFLADKQFCVCISVCLFSRFNQT